ncbi:MAG: hypothetical protein IJ859_01330 [Synergistaceae bacterium]|nr:hypothetical protein [Synergistaceae bacterium]
MAVTSDLTKVSVVVKLNNGTTEDDKVKTLSLNLGGLNIDRYEDQKAMNIVNLLTPCLAKDIYEVQKVAVSTLSND